MSDGWKWAYSGMCMYGKHPKAKAIIKWVTVPNVFWNDHLYKWEVAIKGGKTRKGTANLGYEAIAAIESYVWMNT